MVRLAFFSVYLMLALSAPVTAGNPDRQPICDVTAPASAACGSGWAHGNRFMIRARTAGQNIHTEWRYEFTENRDLKLDVKTTSGGKTETGAVVLINDRAMLTNGLTLKPGQEIDTLGVPVLSLQLVLDLLERTFPEGPAAIDGNHPVHDGDGANGLKISTRGAKAYIPAPWRLSGAVRRVSGSRIAFELTLAFRTMPDDAAEQAMQFDGFWERHTASPRLPDATRIEGWAIHRITGIRHPETGNALHDVQATPISLSFSTLGALRKHISAEPAER